MQVLLIWYNMQVLNDMVNMQVLKYLKVQFKSNILLTNINNLLNNDYLFTFLYSDKMITIWK